MTAQEMNYVLAEDGFLEGEPGLYRVTDKGERYAEEQYHSRGNGGYSFYNPSWETRTWDDEVADELGLTDERKSEIRQAVAEARRRRREARETDDAVDDWVSDEVEELGDDDTNPLVPIITIVLIGVSIYGMKKAAPHLQKLWADKGAPSLRNLKDWVLTGRKEQVEIPADADSSVPDEDRVADVTDGEEAGGNSSGGQ